MTEPTSTIKRALTDAELGHIRQLVETQPTGRDADAAAIATIFELVHPDWGTDRAVRPGAVSIPHDQLTLIQTWCAARYHNPQDRLAGLLDLWVNHGPDHHDH